ncbi:e3 ubiquitin-protein ligase atl41 [Quercus suber]|uniref:RING-type E3 ubiquitin transferase n=1 Tax=Quercus suber TaxID=58331 RepID=A0AAW0KQV6_QUESU
MSSDGTLVLVAVFSLIALVMLVTILQIHFRHQERRRQASLHGRTTQVEPTPMKALDPLVVASLPKFMYKPTDQLDHGEVIECSVCLSTIVEEAMVKLLPNCKHMFHVECIDMWLNSNTTCPICRTLAEPVVKPEDSTLCTVVQPLDPPIEDSTAHGTRLSSFHRMLSREISPRGIQSCADEEE